MKKRTSIFYAFNFAFITIASCILILLFGLYFGVFLKNKSEDSKATSSSCDNITYVIDAGHGGEDAGAIAADGTLEKDLNLEIASLLSCLLELNGNNVKMTRTTDTLLYDHFDDLDDYTGQKKVYDLKNRVKIAQAYENPVFVGIHMNKFSDAKYSGLQVYYSKNNSNSLNIASNIKGLVKKYLQAQNNREVKGADSSIYVLDKIDCPAVLIECGFLSNEDELLNLKSKDYQEKLSLALFCALIENEN